MGAHRQIDGKLSILNFNCQCINSKFDKIKIFLEGINNNSMPISVITLQEICGDNETDINFFQWYMMTLVSVNFYTNYFITIYHHTFKHIGNTSLNG